MANPYSSWLNYAGSLYGVNPAVLSGIAQRESGFNPGAINNWDSNAQAGHPSQGMFQFIPSTFSSFYDKAAAARPHAFAALGQKDINNWKQQALVTAYALKAGGGHHWATYADALRAANGQLYGGKGRVAPPAGSPAMGLSGPANGMSDAKAARISALYADEPSLAQAYLAKLGQSAAPGPVGGVGPVQYNGLGGGSLKDMPRRKGEAAWHYLQRLGQSMFGLQNDPGNSQTTGGHHSDGSYHYSGQAIDFGDGRNSWDQLNSWYNFLNNNRNQLGIAELLNEGDHIHAALNRGGHR